ncbi:hypothetical protein H4582DRAFT_1954516 [Lactarius indigo]|nr:hypothetical protein H4582DRAFT_1954516 [Lactarius indigo]
MVFCYSVHAWPHDKMEFATCPIKGIQWFLRAKTRQSGVAAELSDIIRKGKHHLGRVAGVVAKYNFSAATRLDALSPDSIEKREAWSSGASSLSVEISTYAQNLRAHPGTCASAYPGKEHMERNFSSRRGNVVNRKDFSKLRVSSKKDAGPGVFGALL